MSKLSSIIKLEKNIIWLIPFLIPWLTNSIGFAAEGRWLNAELQERIDQVRINYSIPGVSVSISIPGESTLRNYTSGKTILVPGNEGEVPNVTVLNLFQIGSITKTFTAALILRLESSGLLDIDDPIEKYLLEYPKWGRVTIKQLLNMTSGIKSYSDEDVNTFWNAIKKEPYKQWTPKSLVSLAYNKKPNTIFKPGKDWNYSNTNYVLAGIIVEKVTGKSFNEVIKEEILSWDKNKLINTYYLPMPYPEDVMQRVVHGYNLTEIFPDNTDVTDYNTSWADAAGALVSNSVDLTRFIVDLFSGKVIPQKQFEEITSLVSTESGKPVIDITEKDGYGLGMDYTYRDNIGPIWYKNGETLGYNSFFMWLPCLELVFGITKNNATDDDGIEDLHNGVLNTLLSSKEFADAYNADVQNHPLPSYCNQVGIKLPMK